jgi:CO dehydrogenase/acetyl-CoA synthase beta subunit
MRPLLPIARAEEDVEEDEEEEEEEEEEETEEGEEHRDGRVCLSALRPCLAYVEARALIATATIDGIERVLFCFKLSVP